MTANDIIAYHSEPHKLCMELDPPVRLKTDAEIREMALTVRGEGYFFGAGVLGGQYSLWLAGSPRAVATGLSVLDVKTFRKMVMGRK